jgi:subtilisin family serine protease
VAPNASITSEGRLAHLLVPSAGVPIVKDRYIVELRDDVEDVSGVSQALLNRAGGRLHSTYRRAIKGFSATLSPAAVEALRRNPQVASIGPVEIGRFGNTIQTGAVWNLDRIDQRDGRSGGYEYAYSGQGVHAYVLDSGIQPGHPEFGGRASADHDGTGGSAWDCLGHGTQVAGVVGSATYGVAKQVRIHAIRVGGENCVNSVNTDALLRAIDWLISNKQRPAVANLSIERISDYRVDNAIERLIDAGVTVVTIAGNAKLNSPAENACLYAPARVPRAITVGAVNQNDAVRATSNYGSCVDIFAPGESQWPRRT